MGRCFAYMLEAGCMGECFKASMLSAIKEIFAAGCREQEGAVLNG